MSAPSDDYYALLGVGEDADDRELDVAFRRRVYEPSVGPTPLPTFVRAYAVLSDALARARYDEERRVESERAAASVRKRAPGKLLHRLSGHLDALVACGVARRAEEGVVELLLTAEEATAGGMATIGMQVEVGAKSELFSAWLAVPPGVEEKALLHPSVLLRGMRPVAFRVRLARRS